MPVHRATDIQSKQNCVILHLSLDLLHLINCCQVVVYYCWKAEVGPDPVKNLVEICMGDIMVLSMDTCCTDEISQLLSIAILYIYTEYDNLQIPNIEVSSECRQCPVSIVVGISAVSVMAISDEYVQEAPVGSSGLFFKQLMEFDHKIIAIEQCITHGCASMRMSGRSGSLFEATGCQGQFSQEVILVGVRKCRVSCSWVCIYIWVHLRDY